MIFSEECCPSCGTKIEFKFRLFERSHLCYTKNYFSDWLLGKQPQKVWRKVGDSDYSKVRK